MIITFSKGKPCAGTGIQHMKQNFVCNWGIVAMRAIPKSHTFKATQSVPSGETKEVLTQVCLRLRSLGMHFAFQRILFLRSVESTKIHSRPRLAAFVSFLKVKHSVSGQAEVGRLA